MTKVPGKPRKIAVIGSSNTDMVVRAPALPRPGETVLGGDFFMAPGGKGANQAVAAARAGGEVHFIARIGDDIFGRQSREAFGRDGIHIEHAFLDKDCPSGVALIIVDSGGENCIAVAPGANAALTAADVRKAKGLIASADIVLMQLESPLEAVEEAAGIASSAGVPIVLNPAPARALGDDLLRKITCLTPNETEAEILTGITLIKNTDLAKAADALLAKGLEAVLITLGPKGVYIATRERKEMVPAFRVIAVDATAAGDAFNGALAVALAEKKPLFEAARFANAAAALATTKMGAQPSLAGRAEIEKLLE